MEQAARWEYLRVIYGRYSKAEGKAKGGMLDEFCLTTGYHRKYAIRLPEAGWIPIGVSADCCHRKNRLGSTLTSSCWLLFCFPQV